MFMRLVLVPTLKLHLSFKDILKRIFAQLEFDTYVLCCKEAEAAHVATFYDTLKGCLVDTKLISLHMNLTLTVSCSIIPI